jgi:predicted O-methyltransferase YrrM
MLLINATRIDILTCLPPGLVVAEIGVAEGYYSTYLLDNLKPAKLHLIDPWAFQDISGYTIDRNNTSDAEGDRRHRAILDKFAEPIRNGQVEVHRSLSTTTAQTFPDEYFDLVFIDANHSYAACLEDLWAFDPKVKKTGFIMGHDYQTIPIAKAHHNGVVQAANNFIIERDYSFLALTFEEAPSYLIVKDPDCELVQNFVAAAIAKFPIMAQIANAEHKVFEQIDVPFSPQRYIFSFD